MRRYYLYVVTTEYHLTRSKFTIRFNSVDENKFSSLDENKMTESIGKREGYPALICLKKQINRPLRFLKRIKKILCQRHYLGKKTLLVGWIEIDLIDLLNIINEADNFVKIFNDELVKNFENMSINGPKKRKYQIDDGYMADIDCENNVPKKICGDYIDMMASLNLV